VRRAESIDRSGEVARTVAVDRHRGGGGGDARGRGDDERPDPELEQAVAEVRAAAASAGRGLELAFDAQAGMHALYVTEGAARRLLRHVSAPELLRLAALLRGGRTQLLDRVL